MKDIKFRGKAKGGIWVYGYYSYDTDRDEHYIAFKKGGIWIDYLVDGKTVGQYIGLNDKDGVKIYEDDIVKAPFEDLSKFGVIVYVNAGFHYKTKDLVESMVQYSLEDVEIIGNIYDNKDILGEK